MSIYKDGFKTTSITATEQKQQKQQKPITRMKDWKLEGQRLMLKQRAGQRLSSEERNTLSALIDNGVIAKL